MMNRRNLFRTVLAAVALFGLTVFTPRLFAQGGILQPNGSYASDSAAATSGARKALPAQATGVQDGSLAVVEEEKPGEAAVAAPAPDVDPSGAVRSQELPAMVTEEDATSPESTGLLP